MTTFTDLTDPARDRLDEARRLAETAGGQLRDRSGELVDRAGQLRDRSGELVDRAGQLRDRVPELRDRVPELRDELDPAVRRVRLGFWEAVQVLAASLMVIPRLLVRVLGAVAQAAAYLSGQGAHASQLARDAAQRLPEPRGAACRRRLRAGARLGFAFGVGLGVGWLIGRRQVDDELRYDAPVEPTPMMPTPIVGPPGAAATPPIEDGATIDDVAGEDTDDTADESGDDTAGA